MVGEAKPEPNTVEPSANLPAECTWEYEHPSANTLQPSPGPLWRKIILQVYFATGSSDQSGPELMRQEFLEHKEYLTETGGQTDVEPISGLGDEAYSLYSHDLGTGYVAFRDSNLSFVVRYEAGDGVGNPVEPQTMDPGEVVRRAEGVAEAVESNT